MATDNYRVDNPFRPEPDHLIDPKLKDKNWVMQYIQAAWFDYTHRQTPFGVNARLRYQKIIDYYMGKQGVQRYKDIIDPKLDNCDDETWVNLNWKIPNFAHKFLNVVVGKLNDMKYDITCTAIDPLALDMKKAYEAKIKAYLKYQQFMQEIGMMADPEILGEEVKDLPTDTEELEIQMEMDYKLRLESDIEQAIKLVQEVNKYEEISRQVDIDLALFKIGGTKTKIDSNGFPKTTRVNPWNLVISPVYTEDCRDVKYIGEIHNWTIADLKQYAQGELGEDDYRTIMKEAMNNTNPYLSPYPYEMMWQDVGYGSDSIRNNETGRVKVLELYFQSINTMVMEEKMDSEGNKRMYMKDYNAGLGEVYQKGEGKRTYKRKDYKVWYKGFWIMGTNYIVGAGLMKDMRRMKGNLADVQSPFNIRIPSLINGQNLALIEQMEPIIDDIIINWFKYQHEVVIAPPGVTYDLNMTALEEVALGKGGKNMTVRQLMDLFFKRGVSISRRDDSSVPPGVTVSQGGISQNIIQYANNIIRGIDLLREITGINQMVDASSPNPKQGLGVAEMAISGADNVLRDLFLAKKFIAENTAETECDFILEIAKQNGFVIATKALGEGTAELFRLSAECALHEYGLFLEVKPTDQQWQYFYGIVQKSLETGAITGADMIVILRVDNLKQAQFVLQVREKRNRKMTQQAQAKNMEDNAQLAKETATATEEEKRKTLDIEMARKKEIAKFESDTLIAVERVKGEEERKTKILEYDLKTKLETEKIAKQGETDIVVNRNMPKKETASV